MRQESEHSHQEVERHGSGSQMSSGRALERYKKRLLFQVIAIFSICLIVILERIFYQVVIESEESVISSLQINTDLTSRNEQGQVVAQSITNSFLRLLGGFSEFRWQFLLLTHVLVSLYVGVEALLTAKLLYATMASIYLISLLQLFYGGERPFWDSSDILSSSCLAGYSHPTLGLVLALFVPYYFFYCWRKRSGEVFVGKLGKGEITFFVVILVLVGFLQFMNYFTGGIFLINIAMGVVCFLLIAMIAVSLNTMADKAIRKSTIIQVDAKKYVFYWLLLICLLETFMLIVYSGQDLFLDIDWVKNYIACTKYQDYDKTRYRYDEVIGPWFTFLQTASMFGWIGGVFGISACYRLMKSDEWCGGSTGRRVLRMVVANLLIAPSWVFVGLLEGGDWVKDIGLNEFIVDGVHYFVLYIWLFGYMPYWVLERGLKLTHQQQEDYYVILEDRQ